MAGFHQWFYDFFCGMLGQRILGGGWEGHGGGVGGDKSLNKEEIRHK